MWGAEGALRGKERGPFPPRGAFGGVGSSAFGGRGPFAAAVLEAETVAIHLDNVNMMGKPVQQCAGEPFGAKDFGPLFEGKIAGYQRRSAFIALAKGLQEEGFPSL